MTPEELLAPQPPTVPLPSSKHVIWDLIEADIGWGRYVLPPSASRALLQGMARHRNDFGLAKYGHRLHETDLRQHELQEAWDGLAYSRGTYEWAVKAMEDAYNSAPAEQARLLDLAKRAWARHERFLSNAVELLEELLEELS